MGSVKERVLALCEKQGVRIGTLEKQAKMSNGTISKWTDETIPNGSTLKAIADYFNVSTDYLLGRDEYVQPAVIGAAAHLDTDNPEAIEEYNKLVEYLNFKYSKKD